MPSTARIVVFFLLLVPWGRLPAQTLSNTSANQSPAADAAERPSWVDESWGPSQGPVNVAPPLTRSDENITPLRFEQPLSAGNKEIKQIHPAARPAPAAAASSALGDKQTMLPLSAPNRKIHASLSSPGKTSTENSPLRTNGLPSLVTVLSSLGMVIGIFLLLAYILRRAIPQRLTRLPNEAFELLGRAPLPGKQQVHLLRCGNKLLLVSVTPAGTETLTEITDPQEVDRLAGLCRQNQPHSSTAAFREIFEQLAPKRPSRGGLAKSEYGAYGPSEIELSGAMDWEDRNA